MSQNTPGSADSSAHVSAREQQLSHHFTAQTAFPCACLCPFLCEGSGNSVLLFAGAWRSARSSLSAAWNGSRGLGMEKIRVYLEISSNLEIKEWNIDNN